MAETYCGKTCASCVHKEKLNCPGCKAGPGARFTGDCKLAKCCVSKGHEVCDSCNIKPRCGSYIGRIQAPEYRLEAQKAELQRQEEIRGRTVGLHRVFFVLFWLVIVSAISSLISLFPALSTVGKYIGICAGCIYGLVLLSQFRRQREYLAAGILTTTANLLDLVYTLMGGKTSELSLATLLELAAGVVQVIAIYKEFVAHSEVLIGVEDLADKWSKLWRWYIGAYAATLGSALVLLISQLLGVLLMLAGAIALLVINIVKVVYLYNSARECEYYQQSEIE